MEAINREILIEGVDPRELYGAQDAYLELMRELSPKVKIVARGSSLKALGAKRDVEAFERKMNALVEYCKEQRIENCYLWPAGEEAQRIYLEAGFQTVAVKKAGRAAVGNE